MKSTAPKDSSLYSIENEYDEMNTDRNYAIRKSNCLFTQLFHSEYCVVFFSLVGLMLSIILREFHIKIDKEKDIYNEDSIDIEMMI